MVIDDGHANLFSQGTDTSPVFEDPLDVALVRGRDPICLDGESIVLVLLSACGIRFLSVSA